MPDEVPDKPTGRFQPGNPGRPKGARNRLGEAFLAALADDFDQNGIAAILATRTEKPAEYVKIVASLLPKEITGADGGAILQRIERVIIDPKN